MVFDIFGGFDFAVGKFGKLMQMPASFDDARHHFFGCGIYFFGHINGKNRVCEKQKHDSERKEFFH